MDHKRYLTKFIENEVAVLAKHAEVDSRVAVMRHSFQQLLREIQQSTADPRMFDHREIKEAWSKLIRTVQAHGEKFGEVLWFQCLCSGITQASLNANTFMHWDYQDGLPSEQYFARLAELETDCGVAKGALNTTGEGTPEHAQLITVLAEAEAAFNAELIKEGHKLLRLAKLFLN